MDRHWKIRGREPMVVARGQPTNSERNGVLYIYQPFDGFSFGYVCLSTSTSPSPSTKSPHSPYPKTQGQRHSHIPIIQASHSRCSIPRGGETLAIHPHPSAHILIHHPDVYATGISIGISWPSASPRVTFLPVFLIVVSTVL